MLCSISIPRKALQVLNVILLLSSSVMMGGCKAAPAVQSPERAQASADPCRISTVRLEVVHHFTLSAEERSHPYAHAGGWLDYYAIDWVDDGLNGEYVVRKGDRSLHPAPREPRYNRLVVKQPGESPQFLNRLAGEFHVFEMSDVRYEGQSEHESLTYFYFVKNSCGKMNRFQYSIKDSQHTDPAARALTESFDEFFKGRPSSRPMP